MLVNAQASELLRTTVRLRFVTRTPAGKQTTPDIERTSGRWWHRSIKSPIACTPPLRRRREGGARAKPAGPLTDMAQQANALLLTEGS